jgi:hypothetical protein
VILMVKICYGFVSNSSSGSFIFPKNMGVNDVESALKKIEVFLSDLEGKTVECGLEKLRIFKRNEGKRRYWIMDDDLRHCRLEPSAFYDCVITDTLADNSCPYAVQILLEGVVGAKYIHHAWG